MNDGRRRKASTLIAPPSPRRTSNGTSSRAWASAHSTKAAARSTTGRMHALIAALTVRVSRPYAPVSSCPAHAGSPYASARSATRCSCAGASTANAPLTATAVQPDAASRSSAASTSSAASPCVASRNSCSVTSSRPGASLTSPTRVRFRAGRRSGAVPIPITPTRATSPSSSAFIACVVEKLTSSTRSRSGLISASSFARASATPSLTPASAACVVGTVASACTWSVRPSTATAFVNVPPTSIPTLIPLPITPAPPSPRAAAAGATRTCRSPRRRRARASRAGSRPPGASGGCR